MYFPLTVTLANHLATLENLINTYLVGGFNPVKKYESKLDHLAKVRVKINKYVKPPSKYGLSIMEYEKPYFFAPFGSPGRRKGPGRQHKGSCRMPKHGENRRRRKCSRRKSWILGRKIRELRKSGWEHILKLGWVITLKFWL